MLRNFSGVVFADIKISPMKGRMLDWNYKKIAQKYGLGIDSIAGDDMKTFPIEEARTRIAWMLSGICTLLLVGYGWALEERAVCSSPFDSLNLQI